MGFKLNLEVKLGDLLTLGSVLLALAGFLYGWVKDHRLRNREYADRIRLAAAQTLAGIERWKEVGLRSFDDVQPLITDADTLLVKEQDPIRTRDSLWRALMALQAETSKRILNERLEGAYSGFGVKSLSLTEAGGVGHFMGQFRRKSVSVEWHFWDQNRPNKEFSRWPRNTYAMAIAV
jgi:hypothetical protein